MLAVIFRSLTLAPDFRLVFACVDWEGGEDMRGERVTERLYRDAHDWMPQRLCSTLPWR